MGLKEREKRFTSYVTKLNLLDKMSAACSGKQYKKTDRIVHATIGRICKKLLFCFEN